MESVTANALQPLHFMDLGALPKWTEMGSMWKLDSSLMITIVRNLACRTNQSFVLIYLDR